MQPHRKVFIDLSNCFEQVNDASDVLSDFSKALSAREITCQLGLKLQQNKFNAIDQLKSLVKSIEAQLPQLKSGVHRHQTQTSSQSDFFNSTTTTTTRTTTSHSTAAGKRPRAAEEQAPEKSAKLP